MKKLVAFIAAILCVMLFVGCGKQNLNNAMIAELPKIDDFPELIIDYLDFTFEESVSRATNIFECEFLSAAEKSDGIEYTVRVKKQIKGQIDKEYVVVLVSNASFSAQSADGLADYRVGESYLIISNMISSVYYSSDIYLAYADMTILTENVESAKMYGCPLTKFSERTFADINEMEEYIAAIPPQATAATAAPEKAYIDSDDLSFIASESDHLIQVKPTKLDKSLENEGTEIYVCRITGRYKGNIAGNEIRIKFFAGTVEIGKSYTVALNGGSSESLYDLSSKHSLCTTQEQAEQMINAVKN